MLAIRNQDLFVKLGHQHILHKKSRGLYLTHLDQALTRECRLVEARTRHRPNGEYEGMPLTNLLITNLLSLNIY